jgi:hypothetical protein
VTALLVTAAPGLIKGAQGAELYARAGWVADVPLGQHSVQAQVTIVNDTALQVEHFTYDGTAPAVYFYLGASDNDGDFASGLQLDPLLDRAYNDEALTLTLPPGETLDGYSAVSVWCAAFDINFSSATFTAPSASYARAGWEAFIPPGQHDAEAEATIITDRIIQVDHFTYDGNAPAVYFDLGAVDDHDSFLNGLQIPPLLDRAYSDESVVLLLPAGTTLDGYGALSVWCAAFDINFSSAPFVEPAAGPVPAASAWGVGIMMLLMGTVGTLVLRSGRQAQRETSA